jgi:hypothetical protein
MAYIPVPVETEATDLAEDAFAYIEQQVPGWLPSPGNLEAWLVESLAQLAGELRDLVQLVPDAIFEYYGESILHLPPHPATQATATTRWTAIDDLGYTVDAGTLVAVEPPASTDAYAFEVVTGFAFAPGQTLVDAVTIRAVEAGAEASGKTGTVEALDPLDFVESIVLTAPTSGGADAETTEDYLDRLSSLLTLLSPRPILPDDFALLAQTVPGVDRATAIDLYNADTGETDVPRCVTVCVVGSDGQPCSATVKQQVDDLLQSMREVNFLVFVIDPTYTIVNVRYELYPYVGYDAASVKALVDAALTGYLSPQNWGLPAFGDPGTTSSWIQDNVVRYLEVAQVINNVEGVNYIQNLELSLYEGQMPNSTDDQVLDGVVGLPTPGNISGEVFPR